MRSVISRGCITGRGMARAICRPMCTAPEQTEAERNLARESKSKSELLHSLSQLSDEEIVAAVRAKKVSYYKLESELKKSVDAGMCPDTIKATRVRRLWLDRQMEEEESPCSAKLGTGANTSRALPFGDFDYEYFYSQVLGKNCENVIGFVPIPVGFVGPMKMNGKPYYVPMATTEGALLASTNRGCRAITESGGAEALVFGNAMTRAPAVRLDSAAEAVALKLWIDEPENFNQLKVAFQSTTRFGKLETITTQLAGRTAYMRFRCSTGDAMGMNMISKGVHAAMRTLEDRFPGLDVLSLSGNTCTDKKPSAINWTQGRGKSVVAEAVLTPAVVVKVLKCTVRSLMELNQAKNLVGSALAGSIGGFNAHASNVVTAIYIATGQDPAQNVESSNCMTLMEPTNDGGLRVSVTMPCIEVGTVGGGTNLAAQKACLEMLGVAGQREGEPGAHAAELAKIVAVTVLAGELSLMSALASDHLVSAHLQLNRAKPSDVNEGTNM